MAVTAADEEHTQLAAFPLQPYAEITVSACPPLLSLPCTVGRVLDGLTFRRIVNCHISLLFRMSPPPVLSALQTDA